MMPDTCPYHPNRPSDARYGGTCCAGCEARLIRARERARTRVERHRCPCGGELHTRLEGGLVVKRCLRCRATEQLSPLVIEHLTA